MGSGDETDDRYFGMVIAHFLQRQQKYVSFALGGFKGMRPLVEHQDSRSLAIA